MLNRSTIPPETKDARPLLYALPSVQTAHAIRDEARGADNVGSPLARGRTLTGESPLLVLPALACEVGLPEAVFLQQLHYWLTSEHARELDGRRWIYNSVDQWHEQFPFWSRSALHRIIQTLKTRDLISSTARYNRTGGDRRTWYTINYEHPCLSGLKPHGDAISRIRDMGNEQAGDETEKPQSDAISQIPNMGYPNPDSGISTRARRQETETTPEKDDVGASRRFDPSPLWESFVEDYRTSKNKPAAVGRLYERVIGRTPDYPRLAKMLKQAGSGEVLGRAILDAASKHHTDDPLDYVHAVLNRRTNPNGHDKSTRARSEIDALLDIAGVKRHDD